MTTNKRQKLSFALCTIIAASASAQFSSVSEVVGHNYFTTSKHQKNYAPAATISDLPTKVSIFDWNTAKNTWVESSAVTLEYFTNPTENGYGKVKCKDNVRFDVQDRDVRTYKYNVDGQISQTVWKYYTDNGKTLYRHEMSEMLYDDVVKWFECSCVDYDWDNTKGAWRRTRVDKNTVVRDAAGNVVKVTPSTLKGDVLQENKPLIITYTDGKASVVNDTQEGIRISDIKWAETNGQIVSVDPFSWIFAGNKPLSFTMFNGENAANYTMEYFTDHVKVTVNQGPMKSVMEYYGVEFDNDSQILLTNTYLNSGGKDKLMMSDYNETVTNAIDNEVRDIQYSLSDEGYEVTRWIDYEETLKGKNPATHTLKKFVVDASATPSAVEVKPLPFNPTKPPVEGTWNYYKKIIYSGYLGESGISDLTTAPDDANAPVVYYNLQGQKVNAPQQHGIYIEQRGSKARKVVF